MKTFVTFLIIAATYTNYFCQLQPTMFGLTSSGGEANTGVIFSYATGSNSIIANYSFPYASGGSPMYTQLLQASNSKYYGVTSLKGSNGFGVFFEYDYNTNYYKKIVDFNGSNNGRNPYGSMMQASNGKLYGTTNIGGNFNAGTIFEYNLSSATLTKVFDFNTGNATGSNPKGNLIESTNGKLYGLAQSGGNNGVGTIFEFDPSTNIFTKKINLTVWSGEQPAGSLLEANNGKMYFLAILGGTNSLGSLVEYDPTLNFMLKKCDLSSLTGGKPTGSLIQASNGKLYGLTSEGGANNFGTIIEYDITNNILTKLFDFNGASSGSTPRGSLVQHPNGKLYGLTRGGGINNRGTIFSFDYITSSFTNLFDFETGNSTGNYPDGSVSISSNGNLIGLTSYGGLTNDGTIFEFDINTSTFTKKLDFENRYNGNSAMGGSMVSYTNNLILGQLNAGGNFNNGTIIEFDVSNNTFTKKVDFNNLVNGQAPRGPLVSYTNGLFYGVTNLGGANNLGTIFEYNPSTGTLIKKIDLTGLSNGANPQSTMVMANNGLLYGLTQLGGINDDGIIYEYNPNTNVLVKKMDFNDVTTGRMPFAIMCLASNGKFYGTARNGGSAGQGTLFEYDYITNTYSLLVNFTGTLTGSSPNGELIEAQNGKIYGLTQNGGINSQGVIFEYDYITHTFTKKIDFSNASFGPAFPYGVGFRIGSNGKLYATTLGGTSGFGAVIEYDYITNTLVKKSDFIGPNGLNPMSRGQMLEIDICPILSGSITLNANVSCNSIPSGSATINAYGGSNLTYSWIPSNITSSVATGLAAGIHTCIISNGCSNTITKTITITQPPAITLTASSNTNIVCPNYQVNLMSSASGGNGLLTYSWSTGQNFANTTATPVINTIYNITVTDLNNCTKTETVFVQTHSSQNLSLNSGTICQGDSFVLNASGNAITYTYCCGGPTVYPSTVMVYSVQGTDINGCIAQATNSISILPLPNINIFSNKSIVCLGQSVTLTATGAQTYTWSNSFIGNPVVIFPTLGTTTYSAWGTGSNSCVGVNYIFVTTTNCTNLNELHVNDNLVIYPSPTQGSFHIKLSSIVTFPTILKIYDINGKVLFTQHLNQEDSIIDLSDASNGLYYIVLTDAENVNYRKVVIKE